MIKAGADLAVIGDDDFNLAVWAIRGGEHRGSGDSRKNIVHPNLLLDLAKKGAVNIDTPTNECEGPGKVEMVVEFQALQSKTRG